MTNPIVTVANLSHLRQTRWASVPMPVSQADALPQHCVIDDRYIATKGQRLGVHTQMWHVRMDLGGHASGPLVKWEPWPAGVPFTPLQLTDWVTDSIEKLRLHVQILEDGRDDVDVTLPYAGVEFANDACLVSRFATYVCGWQITAYAHAWSGQDVIDIGLRVVGSDPTRASMRTGRISVRLRAGEPLSTWMGRRRGQYSIDPYTVQVYAGPYAHGYPIKWRGVMGAMPEVPPTSNGVSDNGANEMRLANVWAAHGGPIVAACKFPDGEWLAFGSRPNVPADAHKDRWLSYVAGQGDYHEGRPLASNPVPGNTGEQAPFGSTNGLPAASGAVWQIPLLMHAADDPRAFFHFDDHGPVSKATHPDVQTWEGLIETRMSPDKIGKAPESEQPTNWRMIDGRYIGMDDQHEGSGALCAAYAMTGDYLLRDDILAKIRVDEMRAFPARWRAINPSSWLDAPRATGRLWQFWAKAMVLMSEPIVQRLNVMALREMEMWTAYRNSLPAGAVKLWRTTDNRVLAGGVTSHMPWQDALYTMGALEMSCARARVGLRGAADVFLTEAIDIGRQVVQYGTVRTSWGAILPINGLLATPDGSPQSDAEYYTYPRPGAGEAPLLGINMMVGGPGWWSWYAGAIAAALHGPRDGVYDLAHEIYDRYGPPASPSPSVDWHEWWAIPTGGAT